MGHLRRPLRVARFGSPAHSLPVELTGFLCRWQEIRQDCPTSVRIPKDLVVVHEDPFCAESPLPLQEGLLTPVHRFYVRDNFPAPSGWTGLRVEGAVARPFSLGHGDLDRLPRRRLVATLECAGNGRAFMEPPAEGEQWRLGAVSTAEWEGVPLAAVLDRAGLQPDTLEVLFEGADGFARSLPVEKASHPDTLLALTMNGGTLTPEHGAPLRLLVPGWYGMASVKWLCLIEALREPFHGYFQVERYVIGDRPIHEMEVRSVIVAPAEGVTVPRARQRVRGLAWTGRGEVASVELSDNGGMSWLSATLSEPRLPHAWCWWEVEWLPKATGAVNLLSRATDSARRTQPLKPVLNRLGYCNNASVPVAVVVE